MQELITAANVAGLFKNKVFGRRTPEEWTLLIVVSVERGGEEGTVTAEFLDSQNGETTQFKCRSAEPILELGDFVSVKGNEISLVHKPTLTPIRFIVGALIVIPQKTNEPPPPPPRPAVQPFGEWGKIFPDQTMTLAAIDRLVHHATILEMNVDSYRRK
jgi:hypothetical protein